MKSKGRGSLHAATEPDLHTGHVLSLHGDQEEAGPRHWGWQTDSNLVPRAVSPGSHKRGVRGGVLHKATSEEAGDMGALGPGC